MQRVPINNLFEYWDEAPHDWASLLKKKLEQGSKKIIIPILWGVHESAPGIRDFSKQSRFRIEKVLTTAQELGILVDIVIGFPPHSHSFPNWIFEAVETEEVPSVLWNQPPPFFSSLSLPSPKAAKLKESLFSFFEEVDSILSLYVSPEGPITNVWVDLTPLEVSKSLTSDREYQKKLKIRYPDIEIFNQRFQTHYKDISGVMTEVGCKVAESKRPWLFAFDYQWCRDKIVEDFFNEVLSSCFSDRIRKIVKRKLNGFQTQDSKDASVAFCFEGTLIQSSASGLIAPLILGEQPNSANLQAFEWAQVVSEVARSEDFDFFVSRNLVGLELKGIKNLIVINGKYMAKNEVERLYRAIEEGKKVFFPMGLPLFDESFNSHNFSTTGVKTTVLINNETWFSIPIGLGCYYYPLKSSAINNSDDLVRLSKPLVEFAGGLSDG